MGRNRCSTIALGLVSILLLFSVFYKNVGLPNREQGVQTEVESQDETRQKRSSLESNQTYEYEHVQHKDTWLPQTVPQLLGQLTLYTEVYNFTDKDMDEIVATLRFAKNEMSAIMRSSGRPYFQHCIGMMGCMLDHGASLKLALSSLVHSIYVFGKQAQALSDKDDICALRKKVVASVGLGVEYHAWCYTIYPRANLGDSAVWLAREAIDRGLLESTKMGPKMKGAILAHYCNELDEFYQFDQVFARNRFRSEAFKQNSTYVLNKLGYPRLAEKLKVAYAKHDRVDKPITNIEERHTKTSKDLEKKLKTMFREGFRKKFGPFPRKFHRIKDFERIDEHYILDHFDDHFGKLENMCPDIPLYIP